MSQISIPNFPGNFLVPGVYLTVDASQANTASIVQRGLIIAQQNSVATIADDTAAIIEGTYTPEIPVIAGSVAQVTAMAGNGSQLARAYNAWRQVDQFTEVWLLPLNDDPDATNAAGAIVISGTATSTGDISLYVAGQLVTIPVLNGETSTSIGYSAYININAAVDLPLAASPGTTTSGVYTMPLTAKNAGALGNDIDLRINYLGSAGGESLPSGIEVTLTPMAGGTVNPNALSTALGNLSSTPYDFIALAANDAASLLTLQLFLNDEAGRWSVLEQIFGHTFAAFRGTLSQRTTFFATRDDQHASIIGFYDSPSPVWEWAASLAAAAASSITQDPALPVTGYILPVLAPPQASQDTISERNTCLVDGCATFTVNSSSQVVLERVPTTYTTNPVSGAPDNSYQDVETMFTLMAVIRDLRTQLQTQFARKKLVADGTPIPGGSGMVTSQTVLAAVIARYRTQADVFGWVQNPDQFAKAAIAQNAGGGQVRLFLPVQLANQLRQIVANVQFTKP